MTITEQEIKALDVDGGVEEITLELLDAINVLKDLVAGLPQTGARKAVEVTETYPDGSTTTWRQVV